MDNALRNVEAMNNTFENELAVSNRAIFEDVHDEGKETEVSEGMNGDKVTEEAKSNKQDEEGNENNETGESQDVREHNGSVSRPVTSSSCKPSGPVKVRGVRALAQRHQEALFYRNA